MVACLIVIVAGAYELIIGNTKNLTKGFEGTTTDVGLMALAFYNGISTLFEQNLNDTKFRFFLLFQVYGLMMVIIRYFPNQNRFLNYFKF